MNSSVMNSSINENVYLPKTAVIDRVVSEIPEVKTFYWHFDEPGRAERLPELSAGAVCRGIAVRHRRISYFPARQSNRGEDVLHGAPSRKLHLGPAPLGAGRKIRHPRPLWKRLSDASIRREKSGLRCRRHRTDSAAFLHRVCDRKPGKIQTDPDLSRRQNSARTDVRLATRGVVAIRRESNAI